jgi:hypothetical protein
MLNVNKIFTTQVRVSVESAFTFVRGFFEKRYFFPKKTGRIREQTTNKPKRRVEELTVLDTKKSAGLRIFCFIFLAQNRETLPVEKIISNI